MQRASRLTRRACLSGMAGGFACLPAFAAAPAGRIKITGFDMHKVSL